MASSGSARLHAAAAMKIAARQTASAHRWLPMIVYCTTGSAGLISAMAYNEGMKRRRWWLIAVSLALLAACVGCNSSSGRATSPTDSQPKSTNAAPIASQPAPISNKEDPPVARDAPPWSGSRQFRLCGERFALSADGWLCLDIEDGIALIELPLRAKRTSLSVRTIHLGTEGIQDVAFSPNGKWVAAIEQGWSGPAPIYLIDRDSDSRFRRPKLFGKCEIWADSWALEFSDDSKWLRAATFGYEPNNTRDRFDVKSLRKISSTKTDASFPGPSPTSPDGRMTLSRRSDKAILTVTSGGREIELEAPGMTIHQEFGFLTNAVVAGFTDKGLCLWSLHTRKIAAWISCPKTGGASIGLAGNDGFQVRYQSLLSLPDALDTLHGAFRELFGPPSEEKGEEIRVKP